MTVTTANDSVTYQSPLGDTQRPADLVVTFPAPGATGTLSQQVQGNAASGATDVGNPVKVGGLVNASGPTALTTGQRSDLWVSNQGAVIVGGNADTPADGRTNAGLNLASPAGSGFRGLGIFPYDFNGISWDRKRKPNATSRIVSAAASTNATSVKASAGDLCSIIGFNAAATLRYLKFYNKASAPTVGTDTPVLTIVLPATAAFDLQLNSMYFSTGIAFALTTGSADSDTGALTAGDVTGLNITYA